ncbi:MAG: leucine-rich repeat domain-containing protein, partial [Clostridia bacterium]|nr:leucine-rich repeat domain-containing protein [Clostridia bacterium]
MKRILPLIILTATLLLCLTACHNHWYDEWFVTKIATCTEEGVRTRYCACGLSQTEVILPIEHRYVDGKCESCGAIKKEPECKHQNVDVLSLQNPTCTESGLTEGEKCSDCGEILLAQEKIDALGHNEITDTGTDATCTQNGLTEGKHCSVCNEIIVAQAVIDAKGHTEVIDASVSATCTQTGLTEGKHCSVCDEILIKQGIIPVVAHTYDDKYDESCNLCGFIRDAECAHRELDAIPGYAATCTEPGLTDGQKCKKCGEIITNQLVIDAKGHTEVIDPAVAPTCTETGLTEGKHCSVCDGVIVAQTVIDAKGHTEVIDEAVDATCTETGLTEGKHCSVCDEVIVAQTVIDAKGHTEVIDAAVDATCTETGLTEGKHCSVCDEIIVAQTVIDATGHSIVNGKCQNCDYKYSEGLEYTSKGNGTCYVSGIGSCTDTDIVIPETSPNNERVVAIGEDAFSDYDSLSSVVIPNSVTTIDYRAFYGCSNLSSVLIPDSVNYFGEAAFYGCHSSLYTEYDFVKYVRSGDNPYAVVIEVTNKNMSSYPINENTRIIAASAFVGCSRLTSIEIPDGVTAIGTSAFSNCDSLTSVVIP